jgi:hypothetical protein
MGGPDSTTSTPRKIRKVVTTSVRSRGEPCESRDSLGSGPWWWRSCGAFARCRVAVAVAVGMGVARQRVVPPALKQRPGRSGGRDTGRSESGGWRLLDRRRPATLHGNDLGPAACAPTAGNGGGVAIVPRTASPARGWATRTPPPPEIALTSHATTSRRHAPPGATHSGDEKKLRPRPAPRQPRVRSPGGRPEPAECRGRCG